MSEKHTIDKNHPLYINEFLKFPQLFRDLLFGKFTGTLLNPKISEIKMEDNEVILYNEIDKNGNGYCFSRASLDKYCNLIKLVYNYQFEGICFGFMRKINFLYSFSAFNGYSYGLPKKVPFYLSDETPINYVYFLLNKGLNLTKEEFQNYIQNQKTLMKELFLFPKVLENIVFEYIGTY